MTLEMITCYISNEFKMRLAANMHPRQLNYFYFFNFQSMENKQRFFIILYVAISCNLKTKFVLKRFILLIHTLVEIFCWSTSDLHFSWVKQTRKWANIAVCSTDNYYKLKKRSIVKRWQISQLAEIALFYTNVKFLEFSLIIIKVTKNTCLLNKFLSTRDHFYWKSKYNTHIPIQSFSILKLITLKSNYIGATNPV